jgi:hypothetical protein
VFIVISDLSLNLGVERISLSKVLLAGCLNKAGGVVVAAGCGELFLVLVAKTSIGKPGDLRNSANADRNDSSTQKVHCSDFKGRWPD